MSARPRILATFATAAVLLMGCLWLLTYDVYSDTGPQYAGDDAPASGRTFCGSAYDIALIKGDGFMGGEVPVNQRVIDLECVPIAGRMVAMGVASGTLAIAAGAAATAAVMRRRRTTESRTRSLVGTSAH